MHHDADLIEDDSGLLPDDKTLKKPNPLTEFAKAMTKDIISAS